MTRRALFLLLLSLFISASARGENLVVPALGAPAELVLTNHEPREVPVVVTVYGPEHMVTMTTLAAHATAVLPAPASGLIRVSSADPEARFSARCGRLPALPIDALPVEELLQGDAIAIANPWPVSASVTITLHDVEGRQLERLYRFVPAMELLQLDVPHAASVRVRSQVSVYASNGTSVPETRIPDAVAPSCIEPAFLGTAKPGRNEWLVVRKDGMSMETLTPQRLAALRCDGSVEVLEQP